MSEATPAPSRLAVIATALHTEHAACEQALTTTLSHAVRAGELLLEAKTLVRHGEWRTWLAANFTGSQRTAQQYMRVAREDPQLAANSATVAELGYREALHLLAAPRDDAARPEGYWQAIARIHALHQREVASTATLGGVLLEYMAEHGDGALAEFCAALEEQGCDLTEDDARLYIDGYRMEQSFWDLKMARDASLNPIAAALTELDEQARP